MCFSSGDIYASLGISLSCSLEFISELFCGEVFGTFVIFSAILLPTRLPVASTVAELLRITLFEVVLNAPVADCLVG